MPSASKRRKAAKKKKVKEANINPLSDGQQDMLGSDDLKSQDERGSDAGEVSDFESVGLVKTKEDTEESNRGNKSADATSTYGSPSEKDSDFKSCNSILEPTTSEYLGKYSDPAPAQMTLVTENTPYKETDNSVKPESSVPKEKSSVTESSLLGKSPVAKVGAADLGMKRNDDKVGPFSDENARVLSLEEPKQKEYDSNLPNSSYGSPIPESSNAIEHAKDSEIPECSEDQPLVASGPAVQKTSWLNCCGLFEVLGSSR